MKGKDAKVYRITDYDTLYRPYDKSGGELKHADWVKLPVNPRGDGLNALLEYKRGLEVFGVWCLLLEKATSQKPENRGKLLNHKDQPATIPEIASGISLKKKMKLVKYALSVLTDIGWVSCDAEAEETSEEFQKTSSKSSVVKSSVEKNREEKNIYIEFVKLAENEHTKLTEKFGSEGTEQRIAALNDYIGSTGRKYKSHYHTILSWERKNKGDMSVRKQKLLPLIGKTCSTTGCGMPAVYKDASGSYDRYACKDHLPDKVKEKYE